jgi:hypothetical protein
MNQQAQAPEYITQLNKRTGELERINLLTGESYVPVRATVQRFIYTVELGNEICDLVRQGHSILHIGSLPDFPTTSAIYGWAHTHPDFREKLECARRDRAEFFHDKVLELVGDGDIEKDAVPGIKLAVDTYKWAAEKNDPDRYGSKRPENTQQGPTVIMIDTGFNSRKLEHLPIEAECKEVLDTAEPVTVGTTVHGDEPGDTVVDNADS